MSATAKLKEIIDTVSAAPGEEAILQAALVERDAFDLCWSLFPNSTSHKRASKLLDEATKVCQRLLTEWQPSERQRRMLQ